MKLQHTPGPWEAIHYAGTDAYSDVVAGRVELVDGSHSNPHLSPEDACLIAAAPELLDALETLVASLAWEMERSGTTYSGFESARAAILKAYGL